MSLIVMWLASTISVDCTCVWLVTPPTRGHGDPQGLPMSPQPLVSPQPPMSSHVPGCHLAGQRHQRRLHLCVVRVLEQVIGLKDVVWLHPVALDGAEEVPDVLQLWGQCSWDPWTPLGPPDTPGPPGPSGILRPPPPPPGIPNSPRPLTLCQFWTGSFTFCTEPGCSLLISLGSRASQGQGRVRGGRVRGQGQGQGRTRRG